MAFNDGDVMVRKGFDGDLFVLKPSPSRIDPIAPGYYVAQSVMRNVECDDGDPDDEYEAFELIDGPYENLDVALVTLRLTQDQTCRGLK
jgi:hypothetical protein